MSKDQLDTAVRELEEGKTQWISKKSALQAVQAQKTIAELEMGGTNNMTTSINAHIARLNEQIADIQRKLGDSAVPARGLPSVIVDIDKDRNIIHVDESEMRAGSSKGAQQDEGGADVWTKIAFNIEAKSDSSSTNSSSSSGGAHLKVGGWWSSVQADSSFSAASKTVTKQMSECSVDGSFSAMLVTIRRS
ncbi:hypothetical protein AK830_g413 [Neonectria ditissima]|uniref:Uncharacterized protein n=1 Tax=Neonectria ditissima TaxID=78410 RepID=A0A0P7BL70_9HYPO|nr:hypothetical protein AK830_g413 [Neonectria ditissima]